MYHWITLLYTWNEHNIVSQLYSNIKKLKKKNKVCHQEISSKLEDITKKK